MKHNYITLKITTIFLCFFTTISFAQNDKTVWNKISKDKVNLENFRQNSEPKKAKFYDLNTIELKKSLITAPKRNQTSKQSGIIVEFPDNTGELIQYKVVEASVMDPILQNKYPELRSYAGYNIERPESTIRFSITPKGVSAMIFSTKNGTQYIDPVNVSNDHIVYAKKDLQQPKEEFICGFEDDDLLLDKVDNSSFKNADDGMMREFRLALATTIEYSAFHIAAAETACGCTLSTDAEKKSAVMAELTIAMTRVNGIYERDLSLTMKLVSNNDAIIFVNSDSYSNDNGGAMLGQNQSVIDGAIGAANYDIGHVFSTGGGGVAFLNSPCGSSKAGGVTGLPSPVGDPFYVDYVSHEMGHQFGAPHTFNGTSGSCGTQRTASNAYEPGSASTIMGYAGICPGQNVQSASDAYFHQKSLQMMWDNITSPTGSNCASLTATGNTVPTADAGNSYTIPGLTPYILTGSSTDVDGIDTHTYTWEQYDLGPAVAFPLETTLVGPLVRSYEGTSNPSRIIPNLTDLNENGGVSTTWEKLSSVDRDINFRLTVRDNDLRGGQTAIANTTITVDGDSGPFRVTSQNTEGIVWNNGDTKTITWDIASTNAAPINTSKVNIMLSLDGGLTYPVALASNIDNDGSEDITVPYNPAPYCRIKVEPVDNIYFAINTVDFAIDYTITTTCTTYSSAQDLDVAISDFTTIFNTLNISDSNVIDYVNVNVDAEHTYIRDLIIQVQHPNGSSISTLWNRSCDNENNLDVTFKDGSPTVACAEPTVGDYTPSTPLSVFSGLDSSGDWIVSIQDTQGGDTGLLKDWSVEVCTTTTTILNVAEETFKGFKLFPNPSEGLVNISLIADQDEDINIALYDITGRLIKNENFARTSSFFNQQFIYGNVAEGIYFLKVTQGDKIVSKRIVVK